LVKLHYWAVAENYIVVIVASVPQLNALLKCGSRSLKGTESYQMGASKQITVRNTWTVVRQDPLYATADAESKENMLAFSKQFAGASTAMGPELHDKSKRHLSV
jgi:hypothetical protein